jgi:hypothetical protein
VAARSAELSAADIASPQAFALPARGQQDAVNAEWWLAVSGK